MEHKAILPVPLHRSSSNPTHDYDDERGPKMGVSSTAAEKGQKGQVNGGAASRLP